MRNGPSTPHTVDLQEITAAQLRRYREQYRDGAIDATINAQPIEVYLHYARHERTRERADILPAPDAPWVALGKRLTGRADDIVPVPVMHTALRPMADQGVAPSGGWRAVREVGPHATELQSFKTHSKTNSGNLTESSMDLSRLSQRSDKETENALPSLVTEAERQSTYRLLRVASWQVVFYLITTDMMGWFSASKTFSMLGYAPGSLVYTGLFILAFIGGQMLWQIYMNVDSEEFPIRSYADIGERTFGPAAKYLFNILQSFQLLFNVGMVLILQAQVLAALISFKFCFAALSAFFAVGGMVLTQMRTIRNVAWLTNINLFVQLALVFITSYGVAMYDPVPAQSGHRDLSEPIRSSSWIPAGVDWHQQIAGVQLAVFSYGGAMIFIEFLAEMRRPADFWKAALCAQFLCWATYMFFGLFAYSMQGQYSAIVPSVNIASLIFQIITNILGCFVSIAISTLYAHVGCKLAYRVVLRGYFRAPSLSSKRSSAYWGATVVVYFCLAWAVGSAIPNITDINVIVGAACALQFTFTFPPLLLLGHWLQIDATVGDGEWQPGMEPFSNRIDTWKDWSRWKRAISRWWYFKLALLCFVLSSVTLAGLGIYSGVLTVQASFRSGITKPYSCRAPGQPL